MKSIIFFNKAAPPKHLILLCSILVIISIPSLCKSQILSDLKIGVSFDTYRQKQSELYYLSDTVDNYQSRINSFTCFKQNYQALGFIAEKRINERMDLKLIFRIKLYGIKENYLLLTVSGRNDGTGFNNRFFVADNNVILKYKVIKTKKISSNLLTGLSGFHDLSAGKDTNFYFPFGESENMAALRSTRYKIGYNIGIGFDYCLNKKASLSYNVFYSSPFNNNYNVVGGIRAAGSNKYWHLWQKKMDALNFSISYIRKIKEKR